MKVESTASLPPALASWAEILDLFPAEAAVPLGAIVQRLALAIGPLQTAANVDGDDVDGYDGITRRGLYERLLVSEWLLADELPLEFDRRVAMAEHSFLHLARRQPAGSKVSVALFDCGPDQLGSQRIAHLAALIVLARRAHAAGARFLWKPLGSEHPPIESVDAVSILALRNARTIVRPTVADVDVARAEAGVDRTDDVWIVGSSRLIAEVGGAVSQLTVDDDEFDGELRSLTAVIDQRGRPARRVELPLPDAQTSIRLLRDPLSGKSARLSKLSVPIGTGTPMLFTRSGRKLLVRNWINSLISYPVPNSPAAGLGKSKNYRTHGSGYIVAGGNFGKYTVAVTAGPGGLSLQWFGAGNGYTYHPSPVQLPNHFAPLPDILPEREEFHRNLAFGPFLVCTNPNTRMRGYAAIGGGLVFIDHNISSTSGEVDRMVVISSDLTAVGHVDDSVAYVGHRESGRVLASMSSAGEETSLRFLPAGGRAFFGCPVSLGHPKFGLVAIEQDAGGWLVCHREGDIVLFPADGFEVVGVVVNPSNLYEPALLTIAPNRRKIVVCGVGSVETLVQSDSPIESVTCSTYSRAFAYSTAARECVLYSLQDRRPLAVLWGPADGSD